MVALLDYVSNELSVTKELETFLNSRIERIKNVMLHSSQLPVKELRMAGSLEKGTMLRDKPDVDIVFVFNKEKNINWDTLRETFYKNIKDNFPDSTVKKGDNHAVHIYFQFENYEVTFDVICSYSVNSPIQYAEVKNDAMYSGSAVVWNIEYIQLYKNKPYFREVVMLLKDWRNKNNLPILKSFHLELLVAFCYGHCIKKFDDLDYIIKFCFRKMQAMLDGKPIFPSKWSYFKDIKYKRHYNKPFMIGPSNQNDNVLEKLSPADLKTIKKYSSRAVCYMGQKKYDKIFKSSI
jgi:hypothetical protein